MTTIKLRRFGICLAALAMLSACGETKQQLMTARNASCTDLAREIGKREQRRNSARIDGAVNTITAAVANNKSSRTSAGIESTANLIDEIDAKKSLEQLQKIYEAKGCI